MAAGKKENAPVRIKELLGRVLSEAEGPRSRRPEALAVVAAWPDMVGPGLSGVSRAVSLADGRLVVEVTAPAWKQELLLRKRPLIRLINERMGANLVGDMVINVRDYRHGEGRE
jgi:predicted nucleic acid-binding Zn ribbon protein